jgi:ribonuclease HI
MDCQQYLREELKYCLHFMQLIPDKTFHIYTNGSLDISDLNIIGHAVMGAGWILKDAELSFGCRILNFPSSTCPEILAIFAAILAIPHNSCLTIYSDSQTTIDSINTTLTHNNRKQQTCQRQKPGLPIS